MKNKSNQSQNTAICADTIPATQSKHNLYHKITSRIKPNYLGLAMSVLLIIGHLYRATAAREFCSADTM